MPRVALVTGGAHRLGKAMRGRVGDDRRIAQRAPQFGDEFGVHYASAFLQKQVRGL